MRGCPASCGETLSGEDSQNGKVAKNCYQGSRKFASDRENGDKLLFRLFQNTSGEEFRGSRHRKKAR